MVIDLVHNKCRISGCGKSKFLQQHECFKFDSKNLNEDNSVVLFERCADTN